MVPRTCRWQAVGRRVLSDAAASQRSEGALAARHSWAPHGRPTTGPVPAVTTWSPALIVSQTLPSLTAPRLLLFVAWSPPTPVGTLEPSCQPNQHNPSSTIPSRPSARRHLPAAASGKPQIASKKHGAASAMLSASAALPTARRPAGGVSASRCGSGHQRARTCSAMEPQEQRCCAG